MTDTEQRPATRSDRVSVRVTPAGRQAIRTMAQQSGLSESEVARQLLAYGLTRMPPPKPKARPL